MREAPSPASTHPALSRQIHAASIPPERSPGGTSIRDAFSMASFEAGNRDSGRVSARLPACYISGPCFNVNSSDKQEQPSTSPEENRRDDGGRQDGFRMTRKMGLECRSEQPHLDDQQNCDQSDGSVNRCRATPSRHISTPVDTMSFSLCFSMIRGNGRGGGPCRTAPSCTEKYPSWHGHSNRFCSAEK